MGITPEQLRRLKHLAASWPHGHVRDQEAMLAACRALGEQQSDIGLRQLRQANASRAHRWNGGTPASLEFALLELAGEVGELCNAWKKREREKMGWVGGQDDDKALEDELADVVICADLVALRAGIDLRSALERKFNATSEKHGFPERLGPSPGVQEG